LMVLLCAVPAAAESVASSSATVGSMEWTKAAKSPAMLFVAQADASYAKRTDLNEAKNAFVGYGEALRTDPTWTEAYWKASRVAWWVGDHAVQRADKLSWFQ